ncbi:probable palmitoyltransferase ZDHHC12 isoform X2 [Carassius auratus]|uniref:Palmitoyltransferase n=1 Tax=Carassius auratus TaxID=7957 RepID=A0A6P6N5F7_CARAU|nr:probable palmitoyltransferase ZDHHC12 isoform X2 [Carassius auratus]
MFKNVFGSGFLVRTAHVILTWVITLILFLHDTDLRRQEELGELTLPVLFVLLVLVSVLLYFAVSLMDPGFVPSVDCDLQFTLGIAEETQDMIPQSTKSIRLRRCGRCLVQQPMRSKHCQTCQHCVRRYDHHCPWIENCVGERNHRWFVLYLAVQLVVLLWGLYMACYLVQVRLQSRSHLAAVVEEQRCAPGSSGGGGCPVPDRASPPGLSLIPGVPEYHHMGVHVSTPNLLPQALRCGRKPF